ncbi:DoxX family protein [Streptomyces sp. NPDC002205]|uniref:DoxX family protein n=1 Tax=Streptomyces sp. NPDC002205 TaxID=3154411 RepID=UPI00331BE22C
MELIGALEVLAVLAVLGLILPSLVDVAEILTPVAATGLVALVIGAAVAKSSR